MDARFLIAARTAVMAAAMLAPGAPALAAAEAPARATAASRAVIPYTPAMTVRSLAGRADSDIVEFAPNRRMRVGDLRRLDAAASRMRGGERAAPAGLVAPPGRSGTPLRSGEDLNDALRRPGTEVFQLPSGRTVTAEQLRFVMPRVEARLGRAVTAPGQPAAGRVLRVDARTDWRAVLSRPDDTVLESPSGRRVTVGAIKRELAAATGQRATPAGSRP